MHCPALRRCLALSSFLLVLLQAGCAGDRREEHASPATGLGQSTATSFDGVPIAYETRGAGEVALVFVHGWSCDRSYWNAQVALFSESFRVVTLDLAGHGESGVDREAWTIASFGTDVAAVVEQLELDRMILVGHSMGGDVVVSAARLLGDRVVGLVWVDDYRQLGTVRTPEQVAMFMAPFRTNFGDNTYEFVRRALFLPTSDSALVERVARDMAVAPPHIAVPSLESLLLNDRVVMGELAKLDLPVVSFNRASSNPDVESLERNGVEATLVPEVGHFIMMEDPDAFNALLLDAVQRMLR
jgi:pimeloyl-ACP methyl ester carboxylesterase